MQYFQSMLNKYGFAGGEEVPPGAERYREVYVQAINAVAASRGSKFRARPYDRAGLHNWCLIEFVNLDGESITIGGDDLFTWFEGDPMADALRICDGLSLDEHVLISAEVDWSGLNQALMSGPT